MMRHDRGRTFEVILDTLRKLDYHVSHEVIDSRTVVPQHRERIYIVGFKPARHFEFPTVPDLNPRLSDILQREVDCKYTLTDHLWQYLQQYAECHRARGNGFGYGLVHGDSVTRTLSARYHKDGSEILVSQNDSRNPRRLTPRECARLMGFPDSFQIPVSDTQAYRQFGNSVVVPIVRLIALAIVECLQTQEIHDRERDGQASVGRVRQLLETGTAAMG